MLSHHKFLAILSICIVSLSIGVFMLYQQSNRCIHDNKAFCDFLATLKTQTFEESHGTFTTEQGEKASRVNWILQDNHKKIQVFIDEIEAMQMIFTPDQVYVKDYRDSLWWQQSREDMAQYIVTLAFDPEVFLSSFIERYKGETIAVVKFEELACGDSQCIRYTIDNGQKGAVEYVDIDKATSRLVRYAGKDGENVSAFSVQYEPREIEVPTQVKQAEKGQNIFLEQLLYQPSGRPADELEFVQEFEREMRRIRN